MLGWSCARLDRDLEPAICDCVWMSKIVVLVMTDEAEEHLMFAVRQIEQMQDRYKKDYCARSHGEVRGASRGGVVEPTRPAAADGA